MYHGSLVPGFPQHPHRGFETISFMRKGFMVHSDSLGATARFGRGDVQWMTAGSGIVHAEMFPLLDRAKHNETEIFQIWINLPATDKMVPPHFSMLWDHEIPQHTFLDRAARPTEVTVVAGELVAGQRAPAPPPPRGHRAPTPTSVSTTPRSPPGGSWDLAAAAHAETVRTVYVFRGGSVRIGRTEVHQKAVHDYQETHFGGWPYPVDEPNHGAGVRRFARHADGRVEEFAVATGG